MTTISAARVRIPVYSQYVEIDGNWGPRHSFDPEFGELAGYITAPAGTEVHESKCTEPMLYVIDNPTGWSIGQALATAKSAYGPLGWVDAV